MPNTLHPSQVSYTPTGSAYQSTVVIGRQIGATWEAIGFGAQGRPDYLERLVINLTTPSGGLSQKGSITMDVGSIINVIAANPFAPASGFQISLREVLVCDAGTTKKMMILASQTYPTGSA